MPKPLVVVLSLLLIFKPVPAVAWSEGGHHLIAAMAFGLLDKNEQTQLLKILVSHPRYAEDFIAPTKLPNAVEIERWRIGRAGYWPDVARKQPAYNRPSWHYELGDTLVLGDRSKLNIPDRPGALPVDATLDMQDLHIAQAITLSRKVLSDTSAPAGDRALALSWAAHLVADAHQPCHAGSLYAEGIFEEADGDRGANRILIKQRGNMHSLWDQLLGSDFSLGRQRRRMNAIMQDETLMRSGKEAVIKPNGLEPLTWLEESRTLAVQHVYTPEVLASLAVVSRGLSYKPEKIELTEAYLENAGSVARQRACEAAHRLAAVWKEALNRR